MMHFTLKHNDKLEANVGWDLISQISCRLPLCYGKFSETLHCTYNSSLKLCLKIYLATG